MLTDRWRCSEPLSTGAVHSAAVVDDVLQITQLEYSQIGEAYLPISGLTSSDGFTVRYVVSWGVGTCHCRPL